MDHELLVATPDEAIYVDSQLTDFVNEQVPFTQKESQIFLNYVIKEDGVVIAGINSDLYYWGMLYISEVFVSAKFRGQGLGSRLLERIENEARKLGGTLSHCDTFDFLFKDFYLKHGYKVFGALENCPGGHQRYYLSKKL